jgi:predicted P-loop ATPase
MADEENVVRLRLPMPVPDADHAGADARRKAELLDWALAVLKRLGLEKAVNDAQSPLEVDAIAVPNDAKVDLAIRDALYPASGKRAEHFVGLKEPALRRVLANRLNDLKDDRKKKIEKLRARSGSIARREKPWEQSLARDRDEKPTAIFSNFIIFLRHAPAWRDVLRFDEFAALVIVRKQPPRPPWKAAVPPGAEWCDNFTSKTREWFETVAKIKPALGDVERALQTVARDNGFHPVREYFEGLRWDGTPRLDTWLIAYLHVDDTPYARAVGPRWLISSVVRIYEPGCQADHMLVLEGPQGRQKSTALRTLAVQDDWFTDRLSHLSSKEAIQEVAGVLIIELAELDILMRTKPAAYKAFLTRRHDRFRPAYGRHMVRWKRQCIFAGTVNPPADGRYLNDQTGARRFWPATCRGRIDIDALRRDRDQLWAEANFRYRRRDPWWLETEALERLAEAEQQARIVNVDPWLPSIRDWLGDRTDVAIGEVLEHGLGLPSEQHSDNGWPDAVVKRVVKILTDLGFIKNRPRTPEGRQYRYYRAQAAKK